MTPEELTFWEKAWLASYSAEGDKERATEVADYALKARRERTKA